MMFERILESWLEVGVILLAFLIPIYAFHRRNKHRAWLLLVQLFMLTAAWMGRGYAGMYLGEFSRLLGPRYGSVVCLGLG